MCSLYFNIATIKISLSNYDFIHQNLWLFFYFVHSNHRLHNLAFGYIYLVKPKVKFKIKSFIRLIYTSKYTYNSRKNNKS